MYEISQHYFLPGVSDLAQHALQTTFLYSDISKARTSADLEERNDEWYITNNHTKKNDFTAVLEVNTSSLSTLSVKIPPFLKHFAYEIN